MKQSLDIKQVGKSVSHFFERYHSILFFVLIGLCLAAALMMIVGIMNLASKSEPDSSNTINQTFDQTTIKQLQELESRNTTNFSLPSGRTNPFVE